MDEILAAALQRASQEQGGTADWRAYSWEDPVWFVATLQEQLVARGEPTLKSISGERYDLYHDLITRHVGTERVALRWLDATHGWQAWTYDELHARCCRREQSWTAQGVVPGAIVCAVLGFDTDYAVAVLTALRMGACVSCLPPLGERYLAPRLAKLAPQHIVTAPRYLSLLADDARELVLQDRPESDLPTGWPVSVPASTQVPIQVQVPVPVQDRSYTFQAGEPCALLFSPLREPLDTPVPLSCDDAYGTALSDGLIAFSLGSGDHLAAPGFHLLQHQPSLLLAALLVGAAFVDLPMDALAREPARLFEVPLRSVGISPELRDMLITSGSSSGSAGASLGPAGARAAKSRWRHWFKNPEEPLDWLAWRDFVDACDLGDTPASNALVEAAAGGCLMTAPQRPGRDQLRHLMNVQPAPGKPWQLLDTTQSGQSAAADVGVFGLQNADPPGGHVLLSRLRGDEYLYAGNLEPRRAGRIYPVDEVLDAIAALPFVTGASIVPIVSGGPAVCRRFLLLVFTGAEDPEQTAHQRADRTLVLTRTIRGFLGAEFVPDQVEFFPLFARRQSDQTIDHAWCQVQYLTGTLFRKSQTPLFQRLTAVRGACAQASAPQA